MHKVSEVRLMPKFGLAVSPYLEPPHTQIKEIGSCHREALLQRRKRSRVCEEELEEVGAGLFLVHGRGRYVLDLVYDAL